MNMTPEIMEQEVTLEIGEMAKHITNVFDQTLDALIERRDSQYADAIEPLDAERENLVKEHTAIGQAAHDLEELLPAKARQAQREHDELLLSGKRDEAAVKLEEMREAERTPEVMRARQSEISARIEALDGEKRAAARRIFAQWYIECQTVHRAVERAHFIVFLDGIKQAFFDFQQCTDTGAKKIGDSGLFNVRHLSALTADERTPEWASGTKWYSGMGRQ
jgi:hypothetical protein